MAISKATILCARLAALAGATAGLTHPRTVHAGTQPVRWASPVSGFWTNSALWNTGGAPGAPDAANPDDVVIDAVGNTFLVDLRDDRVVRSLTIAGPDAQVRIGNGGSLEILQTASSVRPLFLDEGTLRGGHWTSLDGGIRLSGANNRLDNVSYAGQSPLEISSINTSAPATLRVSNGFSAPGATISLHTVRLDFEDESVTIGYGLRPVDSEISFLSPSAAVAIGKSGSISGNGTISLAAGGSLTNHGQIQATGTMTIALGNGSLVNSGEIVANDALLQINAATVENSGVIRSVSGGNVVLSAELLTNSGTLLAATSSHLRVVGGLQNLGALTATNGSLTVQANSEQVSLGNLDLQSSQLTLSGGVYASGHEIDLRGHNRLNLSNITLANAVIHSDGLLRITGAPEGATAAVMENPIFTHSVRVSGALANAVVFRDSLNFLEGELRVGSGIAAFAGDVLYTAPSLSLGFAGETGATLGVFGNSTVTISSDSVVTTPVAGATIRGVGTDSGPRRFINEGTFNISSGGGVTAHSLDSWVNRGTFSVGPSGTATLGSGHDMAVRNEGLLEVIAGARLTLGGSWHNDGLLRLGAGAEWRMGDLFTSDSIGSVDNAGASVFLDGQWSGGSNTFHITGLAPTITFSGGTIRDGSFDITGLTVLASGTNAVAFENVSLVGADLDLNRRAYLTGDIDLNGGALRFAAAPNSTYGGNTHLKEGEFVLRQGWLTSANATSALTIGEGATVSGRGTIASGNGPITIGSGGTLRPQGGVLSLSDGVHVYAGGAVIAAGVNVTANLWNNSVNEGLLLATEQGRIGIGNAFANHGVVRAESGGTVTFVSASNSGDLITLGGTLNATALTNAGFVVAAPSSTLTFTNLTNTGIVRAFGSNLNNSGDFVNDGLLEALSGSSARFERAAQPGAWSNAGTVRVIDSEIELAGSWSPSALTNFEYVNAGIRVTGTLSSPSPGQSFAFNGASGPVRIDGTIDALATPVRLSGTDLDIGSATLRGTIEDASLLTLRNNTTSIMSSLSLVDASWDVAATNTVIRHTISAVGNGFFNEGVIRFLPGASGAIQVERTQSVLGAGAEITGANLRLRISGLTNDGVIRAIPNIPGAPAAGLTIERLGAAASFRNNGALIADGGRLAISPPSGDQSVILMNLSNHTLTGGEWIARGGGELDFGGRTIGVNDASLRVEGASSRFEAMRTVALNLGSLEIVDHAYHSLSPGTVNGAGATLRIERGAATFGQLQNGGELVLAESASISASALTLANSSRIVFSLSSLYDESTLTITSNAALDGVLEVALSGGYDPGWGDSWRILSAGVVSGDFSALLLPELADDSLTWWSSRTGTDYLLGVRHIADLDNDGTVGFSDLNTLLADFGVTGSGLAGDLNADGVVDFADLNTLLGAYGLSAARAVPTPGAAVVFLSAGAVLGLRRRERA